MRPISDNTVIQIEITNACYLKCTHCTRFVGHHRKPFFIELDFFEKAVKSLEGFPGRIGIMGGEPALHPQFKEILALFRELEPDRRRREFWTAGFMWDEYKDYIHETFDRDLIAYNDHTQTTGKHQPLLVGIEEVVEDEELRDILIDNCWVQSQWSASITPKGAFFCEVAAAQDWLFDGPGGYPVEPGWWDKRPADFQDQVAEYCGKCSAAIPMQKYSDMRGGRDGEPTDVVSPKNAERLLAVGSPRAQSGHIEIFEGKMSKEDVEKWAKGWHPSHFRPFEAHDPEDYNEAQEN